MRINPRQRIHKMEKEDSSDPITSSSDLSVVMSSFSSVSHDSSLGRPLCEYEQFPGPSSRSATTVTSNESRTLSRNSSAHWEELQELLEVRQEILNKLRAEGVGADQIRYKVQSWLRQVEDNVVVANKLRKRRNGGLLFSWWQRRSVLKLKESITTLGWQGKASLQVLSDPFMGYGDTLSRLGRITRGDGINNIIGIIAQNGMGKTRILQELLKEEGSDVPCFDAVIWLPNCYSTPTSGIQDGIAEQLDLSLTEYHTKEQRRMSLYTALSNMRFCLVLDDLRGVVNLEEIGIPRPTADNMSKIVITSNSEEVCWDMGVVAVINVPTISKRQSWELFLNVVGNAARRISISGLVSVVAVFVTRKLMLARSC